MEIIIEKIAKANKKIIGIIFSLLAIIPNIEWWFNIIFNYKNKEIKTMIHTITSLLISILLIFIFYLVRYLSIQITIIKEMKEKDYPEIAKAVNANAETLQKIKEHYVLKIEMPKDFQNKEYMQQFSANVISAIQDIDKKEYKKQLPDMPILYIQVIPNSKNDNDNTRNI